MEGPYRDLGNGFARLTGPEGARRGPTNISCVEDALIELLRNARDADARNIYVASVLRRRRFRTLTVIDDGHGIPDSHADLIFEPGVTTRHLNPTRDPADPTGAPHGAGLSLYHIRNLATQAEVRSNARPTSITATFDTRTLPERSLQSRTRPSRTNLLATLAAFVERTSRNALTSVNLYYGPPAKTLTRLLYNRIIQTNLGLDGIVEVADRLGLGVSRRTVQRIMRGEIPAAGRISGVGEGVVSGGERRSKEGALLRAGGEDLARITDILKEMAAASYLDIEDVKFEARPGEILLRARVHEPEDVYE